VRGQQVILDNPGLEEFFIEAPFGPAWTAYWPYPDHVVLGGTLNEDDENLEPTPALAEEILRRCIEVEPQLCHAQVRGHQVGLRPGRPSVRLEVEQVGDARCVHNMATAAASDPVLGLRTRGSRTAHRSGSG